MAIGTAGETGPTAVWVSTTQRRWSRVATEGAGLALARWSLIGDELRSGQLSLASDKITPWARRYYFVCLPAMAQVKKICALRDWLVEQAASFRLPA